jgi:DNA-binding winged helix-turn-helix (wHTH) protein
MDSGSQSNTHSDYTSCYVKVGGYLIDFDERTVTTPKGEIRNITPSSIKLLKFLLQHTNSYVSLQEVHDVVYGHQYKDDSSSRKQVTVLRKLFDDNDKEKRFIENRLGHGYRLIAPVELLKKEPREIVIEQSEEIDESKSTSKGSWILTTIIGVIALLVGVWVSVWWSQGKVKVLSPDKIHSLTHLRGIESYPEFSRDGKWMLFDFKSQDKKEWQIYVADLSTGELIPLGPQDKNSRMPRWSVNDSKVVFNQFDKNDCEFVSADFDRLSKKLINFKQLGKCSVESKTSQAELWSDGNGIYYNLAESVNAPFIVYSHSFGDSAGWPIAVPPPSGKGDYYFDVNSDGSRIAVLRNKNWSSTEIWVYDTKSRETWLIDTIELTLFSVRWSEDEESVIYKNEFNQIIEFNIQSKTKKVLYESEIPFDSPVPYKQGVAFRTGETKNRDLEKIDLVTGTRELFESSSYKDTLPAVSRDGQQVAWVSNRSGLYQIWYKRGGAIPHQITQIRNHLQFEGLMFNVDGTKLGGTASGRWFVIDLNDFSITWSSSNSYFTNFAWTRDPNIAYILLKDVERSELLKFNVTSMDFEPSGLPNDAFIALDDFNDNITYYATFSNRGFTRLSHSENGDLVHYFDIPIVLNHTLMWSSSTNGLFFAWKGQLYFLEHSSENIELIDTIRDVSYFSMPSHGKWLLNIKVTLSDTDIKYIK